MAVHSYGRLVPPFDRPDESIPMVRGSVSASPTACPSRGYAACRRSEVKVKKKDDALHPLQYRLGPSAFGPAGGGGGAVLPPGLPPGAAGAALPPWVRRQH